MNASPLELALTTLLHGTVTVAAAWGLSRVFERRVPSAVLAGVWALALLKFVVPVAPSFRFSLSTLVSSVGARVTAPSLVMTEPLELVGGQARGGSWAFVVAAWAATVAVLAWGRFVGYRRLRRELLAAPELERSAATEPVWSTLHDAALALGVTRLPDVRVTDAFVSPAVVGFWRPTLVLPKVLLNAPPKVVFSALAHELAHVRRGDQWVRLVQLLAETVFFFWPPVRWASRQLEYYRELACDEAALTHSALTVTDYARTLLGVRRLTAVPAEFALLEMSSPLSRLERRIDMLLRFQKSTKSSRWSASLVVAFVVVALTGSAFAKPDEPKLKVMGSLDKELIQKVVRSNLGQVQSCFEAAMVDTPSLEGKLVMEWTIASNGSVKDVGALPESTLRGAAVSCITQAVAGWQFPLPHGGDVQVTYPFIFRQSPADAH